MTLSKAAQAERDQEAAELKRALRKRIKPGDTIYCVLRHVSTSGMSRTIQLFHITKHNGKPALSPIGYQLAKIGQYRWDSDRNGITINGCGMDMGFALVYALGRYLWPRGTKTPHGMRNGEPDSDGGYALRRQWL